MAAVTSRAIRGGVALLALSLLATLMFVDMTSMMTYAVTIAFVTAVIGAIFTVDA